MTQNPPVVLNIVLDAVSIKTFERYLDVAKLDAPLTNLREYGLGNMLDTKYHNRVAPVIDPALAFAANPSSNWADSVMGHRELMGFVDPTPYNLFRDGPPADYVTALERKLGVPMVLNTRSGGKEAIREGHAEHLRTNGVILYSSMCDPLFQMAAHEDVISPETLAKHARVAFDLAAEMDILITRVITRPYVGNAEDFTRTPNRRDIVLPFPSGTETFIQVAQDMGIDVVSIGKCADVVNTNTWHSVKKPKDLPEALWDMYTTSDGKDANPYSVLLACSALVRAREQGRPTFIMCNLPDTDSLYGHDREPEGALRSLVRFSQFLTVMEEAMPRNGYIIITGDHGMRDGGDYGYHAREAVPVLGKSNFRGFGPQFADLMTLPTDASTYGVVAQVAARVFEASGIRGFEEEYIRRCNLQDHLQRLGP